MQRLSNDGLDHSMEYCIPLIVTYMNANFHKDVSLQSLSARFHFNPCYLSIMFKRQTGVNISAYATQLRMAYACSKLRDASVAIGDLAQQCGYNSSKYFISVFKRHTGVTPAKYRRGHLM